MEEEICQHHKFGFCRYKSECRRKHFSKECEDQDCKTSKTCNKRHPKRCRKYDTGKCRFKNDCAYKHLKPETQEDTEQIKEKIEVLEKAVQQIIKSNKDNEQLKEKLEVLEKVVHALTRKALSFEAELKVLKDFKHERSNCVKEKERETNYEASHENISFNHTELKGTTSNEKNNKDEKLDLKDEMLRCKNCDYSCKKS